MPHATNQGIRIHYRVEGEGPALILQHGMTWSMEGWARHGYVDVLKPYYRLVLVDARGHGKSDKPHQASAYELSLHVGDIVAVLDALDLPSAHFWGYFDGGMDWIRPCQVRAGASSAPHPRRSTSLWAESTRAPRRLRHEDYGQENGQRTWNGL